MNDFDTGNDATFNAPSLELPTVSYSVDNITKTSARLKVNITNNPYNYWRVHYYKLKENGSWTSCTPFDIGTYYFNINALKTGTNYNFDTAVGGADDHDVQAKVYIPFRTQNIEQVTNLSVPSTLLINNTLNVNFDMIRDNNHQYSLLGKYYNSKTSIWSNLVSLGSITGVPITFLTWTVLNTFFSELNKDDLLKIIVRTSWYDDIAKVIAGYTDTESENIQIIVDEFIKVIVDNGKVNKCKSYLILPNNTKIEITKSMLKVVK